MGIPKENETALSDQRSHSFPIFVLSISEAVSFLCFGFYYMKMSENTMNTVFHVECDDTENNNKNVKLQIVNKSY